MDQAKFGLPRPDITRAKDLSTLQKPRCHLTCLILHGHGVFVALSQHDFPKNASVMIEILSNGLTEVAAASKFNLSGAAIHIQADNTVREMKNNPFLKHLCSMVSH